MGQNTGRFCIRVRKSEDWLKLHKLSDELIDDLALENDIDEMVELGQLTFVNDGDIVLPDTYHGIVRSPKNGFYDISWFVKKLADIFEQTAIIIADTTYESETTSRVYYLGEELHYQYFESSDLYYSKDIEKLGAWIGEDVFSLSEFELNYLNEFRYTNIFTSFFFCIWNNFFY